MKPLSPRTRRLYLYVLSALFLISVPAALLYSSGYRYKAGFGLVRTGGIFLSIPYSVATVSLKRRDAGTTGFLSRIFYTDDLAPSPYGMHVERDGSNPWYRAL